MERRDGLPDLQMVLLLQLVLTAAYFDLQAAKIPNWLTCGGTACGIVSAAACSIRSGTAALFLLSMAGILLPPLLLGILFYFRMFGAGDIKLLSMIGSFLGAEELLPIFLLSFGAGAVLSAVRLIQYGNALSRFQYLFSYLSDYIRTGRLKPYITADDQNARICFAVPVLAGLVLYLILTAYQKGEFIVPRYLRNM